jgi:hypothetical protein
MKPEYEFYEDDTDFCKKCYKSALEGNAESQCELAIDN